MRPSATISTTHPRAPPCPTTGTAGGLWNWEDVGVRLAPAESPASYFRFITEPNVEPTNNLAEQAIRFVAIHRRMPQGTRSEDGRRWCERIWTVIQTCGQQQRAVFAFLVAAVTAHFRSDPAPSLVPDTS